MILHYNLVQFPAMTHFGYVHYKEPWIHFRRLTDEYVIYLLKSGELYMEEEGKRYALKRGDFFLLKPGILYSGYKKACCEYFYIHFKHSDIYEADKPFSPNAIDINYSRNTYIEDHFVIENYSQASACCIPRYYHISNESTLAYLFHMLKETMEDYYKHNEYNKNLASCKLTELILRISREYMDTQLDKTGYKYPRAYVKCQALLDYLNNEYQCKINSRDIEQRFDYNYAYLNRVFQRVTGYTISNYINRTRIKKASELIESTSLSFAEIGCLVGIEDPYYFSKLFKKYAGVSPMQYRKKLFIKPGSGKDA